MTASESTDKTSYAGRWRLAVPLLVIALAALAAATYEYHLAEDAVYSAGLLIVVICGYIWVSGIK